ncbi:polysaccharide deacetylase family protein [Maribacter sp. 2308TA10-17]|uniref:polysaccharide deacetylase family protein n=1 Tax=Maribacter sp. 2308TA10-17 TaxID=3386276 RepID=UPI0039BC254A
MKHIFTRILGIDVTFTTKVEDFIKHSGAKITYTKQPLQNEFFIRSNDLLFEQGINDLQITISNWEGIPCFFTAGERSTIPFDIFSASFYLLSRYEEYLPHVKDMHGRFPPKESLAYQNGFLQQPVVDMWAFKLLDKLKERFLNLEYKKRTYTYNSIIDVTTSHGFAHRGFTRSVAGLMYDLVSFKLRRVGRRIGVWFNPKKDPFNNYEYLINLHKRFALKSMFFFQFAAYSTYDKNLSPNNNKFKFLIKSIADYSAVALSASYSSFEDITLLKNEKKRLSDVINRDVTSSRMRYNRVDVPNTYRNLVDAEFTDDYTMGYTHEIGFRAGTCSPFYFYDINLELQQPIRVHPFAFHDYALVSMASKEEIAQKISTLNKRVKNVNGDFTSVFSIELIGGEKSEDWKKLYESVLSEFHV